MRFRLKRSRAKLDALAEAAKMRHALRLRWLDEADRTQSQATTRGPEPPEPPEPDVWQPWITDAASRRMAKAIINLTPDFYTPQERTTMSDEIKVGDTVRSELNPRYKTTVLGVHGDWLWLRQADRSAFTSLRQGWRKVKTPTPCPEGWANVSADGVGPWYLTREAAVRNATSFDIGVLHLSPNGDCEFIRTEEL